MSVLEHNETPSDLPRETLWMSPEAFKSIPERDRLPEELPHPIQDGIIGLYTLIILFSAVGNMLVLIVIIKNRRMHTITNVFLASLATSDLLIAGFTMPFQLIFHVKNRWVLGELMCKFSKYMQGVTVVCSILTLTGMAVDRYYAICHPLRARHVHTLRRAIIIITLFWIMSFLLVIPQLFIQRQEPLLDFNLEKNKLRMAFTCVEYFHDRRHNIAYTIAFYVLFYLIPVTIMFSAYGKIAHRLWMRRPIGDTLQDPRDNDRRTREKKRIVRMLVVIVVLFTLCWFPFFANTVYHLFSGLHREGQSVRIMSAFFQLLGYSNSCINPIIYCFMNEAFQKHLYLTVCCGCKCVKKMKPGSTVTDDRRNVYCSTGNTVV